MDEIIRVNKSNLCKICGKPDWCGYTKDGKIAICMRIENEYPSKNGGWIHYLESTSIKNYYTEIELIPYHDHPKANPDTLHKVYSKFLDSLSIALNHHQDLIENRLIREETIKQHGYKSLPDQNRYETAQKLVDKFGIKTMSTIPGFMVIDHGKGPYPTFAGKSGILIPIKDIKERIIGLQIRIDNIENPKDRYRWFSSIDRANGTSSGAPAHVAYPLRKIKDKIWITEGALKANIAANRLGEIVIGVAGVSNWKAGNVLEILKELEANTVIIAYDADGLINPVVKFHGGNLAKACREAGYFVQIASWPLQSGKGLDDLLLNGREPEVKTWLEEIPEVKPIEERDLEPYPDLIPDVKWPVLSEEAFYGLAGDVARTIDPHTESDPAAILLQFLVTFGSRAGRKPYFKVERDSHYGNLFAVMVGASSKARKGTSFGWIKDLFKDADPKFETPPGGLVSGEGLIFHVRDPIYEMVKDSKTRELKETCKDEGVEDKRLLIYESEFSSVLKVLKREGNTLSEILRQAWDSGDLNTLAKNSKTKATSAHVSLIGHITSQELKKEIDEVSYANGFGNRILWCLVRRSKYLPEGSQVPEKEMNELKIRLHKAIEFAELIEEMKRDEKARQIWEGLYKQLSEGKPGLAGAMASRAEAQVLRLSCIYASLDQSAEIRIEHLLAAVAVWNFCFQSCKFIFGTALGNPVADQIREALKRKPEGMTRSEIYNMFGKNKASKQIIKALTFLLEHSLVKKQIRKTKGRPVEVWVSNEDI